MGCYARLDQCKAMPVLRDATSGLREPERGGLRPEQCTAMPGRPMQHQARKRRPEHRRPGAKAASESGRGLQTTRYMESSLYTPQPTSFPCLSTTKTVSPDAAFPSIAWTAQLGSTAWLSPSTPQQGAGAPLRNSVSPIPTRSVSQVRKQQDSLGVESNKDSLGVESNKDCVGLESNKDCVGLGSNKDCVGLESTRRSRGCKLQTCAAVDDRVALVEEPRLPRCQNHRAVPCRPRQRISVSALLSIARRHALSAKGALLA
eukprot:3627064-Rhodomonas_salina.5